MDSTMKSISFTPLVLVLLAVLVCKMRMSGAEPSDESPKKYIYDKEKVIKRFLQHRGIGPKYNGKIEHPHEVICDLPPFAKHHTCVKCMLQLAKDAGWDVTFLGDTPTSITPEYKFACEEKMFHYYYEHKISEQTSVTVDDSRIIRSIFCPPLIVLIREQSEKKVSMSYSFHMFTGDVPNSAFFSAPRTDDKGDIFDQVLLGYATDLDYADYLFVTSGAEVNVTLDGFDSTVLPRQTALEMLDFEEDYLNESDNGPPVIVIDE